MRTPEATHQLSAFAADTEVVAAGDGGFRGTATDRWNGLAGRPLGGYVLALALRALGRTLPFPDLFIASAFFLQPVEPGPVEIRTEVARAGQRSATGQASLSQNGVEAIRTVATFTDLDLAAGQNLVLGTAPELPDPEDAIDLHAGAPQPTASIADRVEYRVAEPVEARRRRSGGQPDIALWTRLREGGGEDLLSLALLVDAAPPAILEAGASGSTTLELTLSVRGRPSSEWLSCRAVTRYAVNGYHDEDFEIWDTNGGLVAQSRQIAKLPKADHIRVDEENVVGTVGHEANR